jgi:hypothetical protein
VHPDAEEVSLILILMRFSVDASGVLATAIFVAQGTMGTVGPLPG